MPVGVVAAYVDLTVWPIQLAAESLAPENTAEIEPVVKHFQELARGKSYHGMTNVAFLTIRANNVRGPSVLRSVVHWDKTKNKERQSIQGIVDEIAARARETANKKEQSVFKASLVNKCVERRLLGA